MAATPENDLRKVEKVSSFARILSPARSFKKTNSSKGSSPSSSSSNSIFKKLARKFSSTKKSTGDSQHNPSEYLSDSDTERGSKDDVKTEIVQTTPIKEDIKEEVTVAEKSKEPSTVIIEKASDLASKKDAILDPKALKEQLKELKSNAVEAIELKAEKIMKDISSIVHIGNKSTDDHKHPDKGTHSGDDHGASNKKQIADDGAHEIPVSTDPPSEHTEEKEEKIVFSKEREEDNCHCISSLAQGLQAICAPK